MTLFLLWHTIQRFWYTFFFFFEYLLVVSCLVSLYPRIWECECATNSYCIVKNEIIKTFHDIENILISYNAKIIVKKDREKRKRKGAWRMISWKVGYDRRKKCSKSHKKLVKQRRGTLVSVSHKMSVTGIKCLET